MLPSHALYVVQSYSAFQDGTKRYYYGFKRLPQISAAFLEKKFNKLRYISLCTV